MLPEIKKNAALCCAGARAARGEKWSDSTRFGIAQFNQKKSRRRLEKITSLRNTVSKSCPRFDIGNAKAICSRINKVAAWIPDIPDALLNADGREREEGDDLYWPAAASLIYIGGTPCASRICI